MFVLVLSVGIFFLTTDFDSFILKGDSQNISLILDNQHTENTEDTNSIHHGIEDLFPMGNGLSFFSESIFLGKIGFVPQNMEYGFAAQIWQPPKLS